MIRAVLIRLAVFVLIGLDAAPARAQDDAIAAVRSLLDAGRYELAAAKAAALQPSMAGTDPSRRLAIRQLQLEARLRNGEGASSETLALARDLLTRAPAGAPADAPAAISHGLLGDALFESAHYREAAVEFETAARIHERLAMPARQAADLERLARARLWLDRLTGAAASIDRAVRLAEAGPDRALLARTLATRAHIWHRRGRYAQGRSDAERAMALRPDVGLTHPDSVAILTVFGDQLWYDGDTPGARARLAEAAALAEASLRSGHAVIAECLRLHANSLDDSGQLEEAKVARDKGVRIAHDTYGVQHPVYALQLHDLAISFSKRGDYGEAQRLLRQARAVYESRFGPHYSEVGSTLHNLGVLAASLGDFAEAAELQAQAARIWARSVGATHPWVPWALVARAEALNSQRRHAAALPILAHALALREQTLGGDHVHVAATLNAQARSLVALRRHAQARATVDRAIGVWEQAQSAEGLSDALLIRGDLETATSDYPAAAADYARALQVRLPVFGDGHPSLGDARVALSMVLARTARTTDALAAALDGERVRRDHIRLTTGYLPESQALGYASTRARGLDLAVSLAESPEDVARVFDAIVRGRSIVQDEMALRQRLRAASRGDDLGPLWAKLTAASRRLANLAVRGPTDNDDATYAVLFARARQEQIAAESLLAERSATARRDLTRRDLGLDELRARLPLGSAIVAFLRYDAAELGTGAARSARRWTVPSYAAFVLRADQRGPVLVRLGQATGLDNAIRRWRETGLGGITVSGDVLPGAEATLRKAGEALRARIWDPLTPAIADAASIYIVPDGALNLVPFGALPLGRTGYLVDGAPLHYLSAERDLAEPADAFPTRGVGLVAVGGPAYGALPSHGAAPTPGRRSSCGSLNTMTFESLPASRREAEEIGALWQTLTATPDDAPAVVLTGARASEGVFKASSRGRRVLHLATHGFFLGADCAVDAAGRRGAAVKRVAAPRRPRPTIENPLLLSGLALAGANRRALASPDDEDGILTAEEVAALDLDGVEWAVLSACETGLGKIVGGEGVFGLRRAFKTAGARTVIMSLWPVEDRATRQWMRALYQARLEHRRTTSDSMRDASLAVLSTRRAKKLSTHPFFWAGFVAAGDWR